MAIRLVQRIRRESEVRASRERSAPVASDAPLRVGTRIGTRVELDFGDARHEERIPSLLLLPDPAGAAAPAALLLHGLTSDKERMADSIGLELLHRGIASLSIDLPMHGERQRAEGLVRRNPLALAGAWRTAQEEARMALGFLAARAEVDQARIGLVGYSMGSFLGITVAATASHVRALVLAAGGDLPDDTPYDRLVRTLADPIRAVRRLAGRPLLMVHGRHDRTVTPAQAQRLFDAAGEPKELRWWTAGHYLPEAAIEDAAEWMASRLASRLGGSA